MMSRKIIALLALPAWMASTPASAQMTFADKVKALAIIEDAAGVFCHESSLDYKGSETKLNAGASAEVKGILKNLVGVKVEGVADKTEKVSTGVLPEGIVAEITQTDACKQDVRKWLSPIFFTPDHAADGNDCDTLAASPLDPAKPPDIVGVDLKNIDREAAETACRSALRQQPLPRYEYELGRVFDETAPDRGVS